MSEKLSERFKKYWEFGLTTSRANIYRQEFDQILSILKAHEDGWFETEPAPAKRIDDGTSGGKEDSNGK